MLVLSRITDVPSKLALQVYVAVVTEESKASSRNLKIRTVQVLLSNKPTFKKI